MTDGAEMRRTWSSWLRPALGAALCAAALALPACGPAGEEEGAEGPAEEEAGATEEAAPAGGEAGTLEAETWLNDVSIGRAVDPQGAVPAESEATEFAAGDVVYVSMAVGDAPADAAVHVVFYGAGGEKVAEDEKKVPAEARYLYFDSGDTRNWEPGTYRVEVAVDGEVVAERELAVEPAPAAPLQ
jgi:hypothetical protein